jgi:hypothetical protein
MSWGKIYCSTWWGSYETIRYSIPNQSDCMHPDEQVGDYVIRVYADGGVFEAKACLIDQLTTLNNIE